MLRTLPILVALLALPLAACATGAPHDGAAREAGEERERHDHEEGPAPDPAFAPALERAAGGEWGYLRIEAGCRGEPLGWRSTVLFGSGVGIVDGRRQFEVPRRRLLDLLARFREVGFATMPATFGGGEEEAPLQAVCLVGLRVDGVARTVQQLDRGKRSPALVGLAEEILDLGETAGADGVGADDLDDALAGLAAGEVAAEAMRLTVDRRDAAGDGWLLIVDGGFAWVQPIDGEIGFGDTHMLALDAATTGGLAAALREHDFGGLPGNLYDPGYLLVRLDLLGHEHESLAQPFAGMDASTDAPARARLEAVAEAARALAERVLAEG